MSDKDSTPEAETTVTQPAEPASAAAPARTPILDRSWSTRTLAAAAVTALVVGAGGGAALGAISGGDDQQRGGPGQMRQFPDGGQRRGGPGNGQMPQGGPGNAPQQGTPPVTPPDPQSGDTGVPSDGADPA